MVNENSVRSDNNNPSLLADFGGSTKRLQADEDGYLKTSGSTNYFLEIARGNVEGQKWVTLGGDNPNIELGDAQTIWQGGASRIKFLSADTTLYASSSDAGDTAVVVAVSGVDDTYTEVTRLVTLNGQNQVALSGDMFRVFTALVVGPTGALGDIYIAESDPLSAGVPTVQTNIQAKLIQGRNSANNAVYTVPAGKTWFPERDIFVTSKGSDASVDVQFRPFGGSFVAFPTVNLYQNCCEAYPRGFSFPEKTDIEVFASTTNAGSNILAAFDGILIDNE